MPRDQTLTLVIILEQQLERAIEVEQWCSALGLELANRLAGATVLALRDELEKARQAPGTSLLRH